MGYVFVRGSGAGSLQVECFYPKATALSAIFSGLLICVFAGRLPGRTAARKDIVEAVQYE